MTDDLFNLYDTDYDFINNTPSLLTFIQQTDLHKWV